METERPRESISGSERRGVFRYTPCEISHNVWRLRPQACGLRWQWRNDAGGSKPVRGFFFWEEHLATSSSVTRFLLGKRPATRLIYYRLLP
jgi:hypothetical protein